MHRLLQAAAEGNETLVAKYLAEGDDPNVQDSDGTTPLIAASTWGFAAAIEALLEAGADTKVAMPRTGWTPLHAAASQNNGKVLMMLVNKGADPNAADVTGRTPADFASASQAIWPFFEAQGCVRTSQQRLKDLGILVAEYEEDAPQQQGTETVPHFNGCTTPARRTLSGRPQSRGDVLENTMQGDVLSASGRPNMLPPSLPC